MGNPILTTSQTSLTNHRWHVKYSSIIHLHLSVFPSAPCLTAPGDAFTARWKCSTPGTLRHGWCKNGGVQATPQKWCVLFGICSQKCGYHIHSAILVRFGLLLQMIAANNHQSEGGISIYHSSSHECHMHCKTEEWFLGCIYIYIICVWTLIA